LFSRQGWGEIIAAIRQIPTGYLLLAFALTLVFSTRRVFSLVCLIGRY
jgi:uncharacterized membrane protein YbhN (UPF0104 family)